MIEHTSNKSIKNLVHKIFIEDMAKFCRLASFMKSQSAGKLFGKLHVEEEEDWPKVDTIGSERGLRMPFVFEVSRWMIPMTSFHSNSKMFGMKKD